MAIEYPKTARMRELEKQNGGPMEDWLPDMIQELGVMETMRHLEISKMTFYNWLARLRLEIKTVCVGPNDKITIERGKHVLQGGNGNGRGVEMENASIGS